MENTFWKTNTWFSIMLFIECCHFLLMGMQTVGGNSGAQFGVRHQRARNILKSITFLEIEPKDIIKQGFETICPSMQTADSLMIVFFCRNCCVGWTRGAVSMRATRGLEKTAADSSRDLLRNRTALCPFPHPYNVLTLQCCY